MSGAGWIASYFLLCLTVLSLAFGMVLLYHRVQAETLDRRKIGRWPSPLFRPGDAPATFRLAFDAAGLQGRLIVVVARRTDDLLFAAVSAARDIARRFGLRCILVTTGTSATGTGVLPASFDTVPVLSLDDVEFERLGLVGSPATILWDDAVVDAALGFLSPQQIERRFATFLRPQAILLADTTSAMTDHVAVRSRGLALMPPEPLTPEQRGGHPRTPGQGGGHPRTPGRQTRGGLLELRPDPDEH